LEFDLNCNDSSHYNLDFSFKIANKPPKIVLTDDNLRMSGLDIQMKAWKTVGDKKTTLMNIIMGNLTLNSHQYINADNLRLMSGMNIEFNQPKVVEKGTLVKFDRDVYRMSWVLNDWTKALNDPINGSTFKYFGNAHIAMRKWGLNIDGDS